MVAVQVSKNIYGVFIIVNLFAVFFSAQVSNSIMTMECMKDCIINQCIKTSKKATPETCDTSCKIMCDTKKKNGHYNINIYQPPWKRLCHNLHWFFEKPIC